MGFRLLGTFLRRRPAFSGIFYERVSNAVQRYPCPSIVCSHYSSRIWAGTKLAWNQEETRASPRLRHTCTECTRPPAKQLKFPDTRQFKSLNEVSQALTIYGHTLPHVLIPSYLCALLNIGKKEGSLLKLSEDPACDAFINYLAESAHKLPPKIAILCLHHCAKHNFYNEKLVASLADQISAQKVEEIPYMFLSSILWSLKRLGLHTKYQLLLNPVVQRVSETLTADAHWPPGTLANFTYTLAAANTWPEELTEPLQAYLTRHVSKWSDLHALSSALWSLTKVGAIRSDTTLLDKAGEAAANAIPDSKNPHDVTLLSWVFGAANYYHEEFFQALSKKFPTMHHSHRPPRLLSTVVWACSRVRYYDPSLLDCVAQDTLAKLDQFNSHDLSNLAYAFGVLNHPCPQLLNAIAEKLTSSPRMLSNSQACSNIAWACMVHNVYPTKLLEHLFTPRSGKVRSSLSNIHLMQLHVAVTVEHSDLGFKGLSQPLKEEVSMVNLDYQSTQWKIQTTFEKNMVQALRCLTGGDENFITEPMTVTGYHLDAELLLDVTNNSLVIPQWCRQNSVTTVRKLLKRLHGGMVSPVSFQSVESLLMSQKEVENAKGMVPLSGKLFLSSLKELESTRGMDSPVAFQSVESLLMSLKEGESSNVTLDPHTSASLLFNLASDWYQESQETIARRIAIEADGIYHFAANCNHPFGHTVLKHRQLKALGWEVISVPYFEWHPLQTTRDQADYLARRIYGRE